MDTRKLKVGQKVRMITLECYAAQEGTVVKVTPSGVEVWVTATIFQTATPDGFTEVLEEHDGRLIRFDNKGCELDANRRDRLGFGPRPRRHIS